jgi:valyl-tRNA synthetase
VSEALPKRLDPSAIEGPLYERALERGLFRLSAGPVLEGEKDPYVIVIPPPNVTSVLHMGHGLNNTIQDVLVRWRRMQGRGALWVPGTDHAGIATQNVVERLIASEEDRTRFDLGREAFEARVWAFVEETGGTILEQLKAIGASAEEAVIRQLEHSDPFVRGEACAILGTIGTRKSVSALTRVARNERFPNVRNAAQQALRAAQRRR